MRDTIRQQLLDRIPEIDDRCFEPHAADKDTAKPYIVIKLGSDTEDSLWTGFRRVVEVWPNVSWTRFKSVDEMAAKITAALHNQLLTTESGEVFTCIYIGIAGNDSVDKDWDILTRGLRFSILALQPVNIIETVAGDPWLEALSTWSGLLLGQDWNIYQNQWPTGYRRPSVLWRLSGVDVTVKGAAMFQVQKKVIGHVLGSTPNEQIFGIMQLVQGLGTEIKIPLDLAKKQYLTILNPAGDTKADALKAGQISVVLSRMTSKPAEEAPLIGEVKINGEVT
jgi:hypothetical protein